jgi:hypothetical protein
MGDVLYFAPPIDSSARQNLSQFIDVCRLQLSVFGADLAFDNDCWDVTMYLNIKGQRTGVRLWFTGFGPIGARRPASPMGEPFKSFAKATVRYLQGLRPSKSLQTRLMGLRAMHQALTEDGSVPDPTRLLPSHFNRAAEIIRERVSATSAYQYCGQLEVINEMMIETRLLAAPMTWRSVVKRFDRLEKVGPEFDSRRLARLPTPAALSALASIFNLATEPSDVIVSSVMAILCSAPERINEVLRLSVTSEVIHRDPVSGEEIYGLRWHPSKGGRPQVKWTVQSMAGVVRQAIRKVSSISEPAREVATWYETHPNSLFIPADLEYLREQMWLTMEDLAAVLFTEPVARDALNLWCIEKNVRTCGCGEDRRVRFDDVERAVVSMLPRGFPIADADHHLRYAEMLFLVRRNELHNSRATYRCMIMRLGTNDINKRLSSNSRRSQSIFSKYGFTEPDRAPISATTHKIRHYLNTLAQLGGLSQLDIALWSGRARVAENNVYDHVSGRDILAMVRAAVGEPSQSKGPLSRLGGTKLLKRNEFAQLKVPTAHTTDLGYCVHDYSMLPCQAHRDCLNCGEHVCVKGESDKEERLKLLIAETKQLLTKAKEDERLQLAGVHRWVEHQQRTLARAEELQRILDDPAVPAGSVMIMSTPVMPSRLAQAVQERQKLIEMKPAIAATKPDRRRRA